MKALVLEQYGQFVFKDVPDPVPSPGDALVRVRACAVCGSDVHGMDGSTGRRVPPIVMGHEAAGVIERLGADAQGFSVGERVTFDSTVYCGQCADCLAGRVNLCRQRRVLGVSCAEYRMHGAFAEYVAVPARILYRLPGGVDFDEAAMVEPLSVAYHAATRVPVRPGCTCLVVGAGTIGMLTMMVLKALDAGTVIAADIQRHKLAFALAHGADHAVDSAAPDALAQILALTEDGEGVDIAVDAVGIEPTLNLAVEAARRGRSVVLVGNIAQRAALPLQQLVTRELSLFGSCASAGEYPACLDMIARRQVDVRALISARAPLSEGSEWFQRLHAGEPGLFKVVLIP